MCCLLLVCAVLKTLHSVKHVLNEEECRGVGEAGNWDDELAVFIAAKPPDAVQETLYVLEEYNVYWWYDGAVKGIKSKLCLGISLCRRGKTSETTLVKGLTDGICQFY